MKNFVYGKHYEHDGGENLWTLIYEFNTNMYQTKCEQKCTIKLHNYYSEVDASLNIQVEAAERQQGL
jgi:hypothetical protein